MGVWKHSILIVASLMLFGGCRASGRNPHLETELRMQEDRIYELQDCLEEAESRFEALRRENESLRQSLADEGLDSGRAPTRRRADDRGRNSQRGSVEIDELPPELNIQIPSADELQNRVPDALRGSSSSGSEHPGPPEELAPPRGIQGPSAVPGLDLDFGGNRSSSSTNAPPEGPRISLGLRSEEAMGLQLAELQRERIEGASDGNAEEGLSLVVTPRDQEGMPFPAAGELSVVVIDPAIPNENGRIARWDFARWETASLCEISDESAGFRLRLRWPDGRPDGRDLHLFARYTTADGRNLQAEMPFSLRSLALARPANEGGWQRREQSEPREEFVSRRPEAWAERAVPRPLASGAPSWHGEPAEELSAGRGARAEERGVAARDAAESGAADEFREPKRLDKRSDVRVARPVWSPDRK